MLDSNGSNTTAAAAVAKLAVTSSLNGKNAIVLAGTGPVGQRAAAMLAKEGANVSITARTIERAMMACDNIKNRFGVDITPIAALDSAARAAAIENAHIVLATGAAGVELLSLEQWQNNPNLEMIADANATLPQADQFF